MIRLLYVLALLFFSLLSILLEAQQDNPVIRGKDGKTYAWPWAGGMNSCQFCEIDMNLDGSMDLLVFDRQGNRLMPFLNNGLTDSISYAYSPDYIGLFPEFAEWVMMVDYDFDGRNDIFTYNPDNPGVMVYRNVSTSVLKFELVVYPYLTSYYGSGYVNILVTSADYPAIVDLDYDGDLDILTFWALGSFVELHQNQSMEKYGTPDSLDFLRTEYCWGRFAESEESNEIFLDTCFGGGKNFIAPGLRDRHTGSTFLVTDLDDDNDMDLVLGDVDYPGLIKLTNGGTSIDAFMISQEHNFPDYSTPVKIFSMPLPQMIDVNNDGLKDLLANPFDGATFVSRNYASSWLYMNSGTNTQPVFHLKSTQFLQDDMIDLGSGAYPIFYDLDGDGLTDILAGNYGYYDSSWYDVSMTLHSEYVARLSFFRNTGTPSQPCFTFVDDDLAGISVLKAKALYPTLTDIDADGDPDLLVGKDDGKLLFYRNQAQAGADPDFILETEAYMNIDVGDFSTPFWIDIDEDGLTDLIIGEKAGTLNYYRNTGTAQSASYSLEDDFWGEINVTDPMISNFGYSTPFLFYDQQGRLDLVVGSEQGSIFYFPNVLAHTGNPFPPSDSLFSLISNQPFEILKGWRMSATLADIDQDNKMEMICGNLSGGMHFYPDVNQPVVNGNQENQINNRVQVFPNPANDNLGISLNPGMLPANISFVDSRGKVLIKWLEKNQLHSHIDISNFVNGVYFLEVQPANNPQTRIIKKLIIIK
ncbi:MAG: T9SS type A sorting domain-containing protein [Bacteroidetes bacterium]|nr:T9SS type A sorting domain-containing protein [Bacteroidota bacterium]